MKSRYGVIFFCLALQSVSDVSGLKIRHGHEDAKRAKVKLHAFYLNMQSDVRRSRCLETQLSTLFGHDMRMRAKEFTLTRVAAVSMDAYDGTPGTLNKECKEAFHDWAGNLSMSKLEHPLSVEASYCGHVNMWRGMADAGDADYYLALEDDTAFTKDFATWWKAFEASSWTRDPKVRWDVLYLDPFGHADEAHFLGRFQDTDIYEPRLPEKGKKKPAGSKTQYYGSHAYLIRADALPQWRERILSTTPRPADHFFGNQRLCSRAAWMSDLKSHVYSRGERPKCETVHVGLRVMVARAGVTGQRSRSTTLKGSQPEQWLSLPECQLGNEANSREKIKKERRKA